jgi:hypothetical protein
MQLVAVQAYLVDFRSLCAETLDSVDHWGVLLLELIEICHAKTPSLVQLEAHTRCRDAAAVGSIAG